MPDMEEALIKRVPPHSIEAEQSVVGAMLMDKDAIMTASEIISGSDFYQTSYGVIFDSMTELFNEGKPVDLIDPAGEAEGEKCAGGDLQPGVCPGSGDRGPHICKCKVLRTDRL